MKIFITVCAFFCMAAVSLAAEQAAMVYDGAILTEDVTWRGSILVKRFVVIAPQATLRIDPGTVVRFTAAAGQPLANLVVQGRIHAAGTAALPIVLTSDQAKPLRGAWEGVVLLSTGKRNVFEHCRIEYAETGLDLRSASATLNSVSLAHAHTALSAHDSVVQLTECTVTDSATGLDIHNSECDAKVLTVSSCQSGCVFRTSGVELISPKISGAGLIGLDMDGCRINIVDGEFSDNTLGVRIRNGQGRIGMSRFQRNSETALHLLGSPVIVQRCLFSGNTKDAVHTEDGRSLFLNNVFTANGGYNLINAGSEPVSARLNWWGTTDAVLIGQKVSGPAGDNNVGTVHVSPWLEEKPLLVP